MKILVVTRITSFITDMMDDWRDKKGYEVKLIPEYNEEDVTWADVIICDFVDNRLQSVAEHPLAHKKIVIGRLHRVEWYKGQPRAGLKWENVNYLVFTGKYFLEMFNQSARKNMIKDCKAIHIPYGIDLEKFNFKERKHGLNIAWVAKSYWARKILHGQYLLSMRCVSTQIKIINYIWQEQAAIGVCRIILDI